MRYYYIAARMSKIQNTATPSAHENVEQEPSFLANENAK